MDGAGRDHTQRHGVHETFSAQPPKGQATVAAKPIRACEKILSARPAQHAFVDAVQIGVALSPEFTRLAMTPVAKAGA